jgi:hypothetical protein
MVHELRALRCGVRIPVGARDFFLSSPNFPDCFWGPPSLVFSRYWSYFLAVNGPQSDTDLSSQSSADVQNELSLERDSFIFLVTS